MSASRCRRVPLPWGGAKSRFPKAPQAPQGGRRLSARWKSARFEGSIPSRVHQTHGLALSFPLFRPIKALKSPPAGPRGPRAEGDTRDACRMKRLTVEFEPCAGDVAQLGERLLCTQGVTGSSPVISTSTLSTE
jgi:hypothetical protein